MKITAAEAQAITIFHIDRTGDIPTVEKSSLYDFVMESAEQTTSPRGVENKLHVREVYNVDEETGGETCRFEVRCWGPSGHGNRLVDTFDTEEEADDYIYQATEAHDFSSDDQRDTCYYHTEREAMQAADDYMIEEITNAYDVEKIVAQSILSKMKVLAKDGRKVTI